MPMDCSKPECQRALLSSPHTQKLRPIKQVTRRSFIMTLGIRLHPAVVHPAPVTRVRHGPSRDDDAAGLQIDRSQALWVSMYQRLVFAVSAVLTFCGSACAQEPVQFSRDILPILSDRCFHCHGPDAENREANLRLDLPDDSPDTIGANSVIDVGDPEASELLRRITSNDPDLKMPPSESHRKELSPRELETFRKWIAQGAPWGQHWAFEKPVRPELPAESEDTHGAASPMDRLVMHKLRSEGLAMSPRAEKHVLARRVSFDLIGLPPAEEELHAFLTDSSPDAYRKWVDRLLESPHFGERMAMWWLDAARYSDTDGYQQDATRQNWPWRDWVIDAFNDNMPFDQFTVEQFAGDLLPDATPQQILATCFHRNHMTNGEGGRDPEESRVDYVMDRVNTTGSVWLGLTLNCAQCHAHKFDPISHEDYYRLFAFFNSIDEDGRAGDKAQPYHEVQSQYAQRAVSESQAVVKAREPAVAAARSNAEAQFEGWLRLQIAKTQHGFQAWHPLQATSLESVEGTVLSQEPDGTIQVSGPNPRQDDYRLIASAPSSLSHPLNATDGTRHEARTRITGLRLEVFPDPAHTDGKLSRGKSGEFILTDVKLQVRRRGQSQLRDIEIESAVADVEKKAEGRNYGKVSDTLDDDPRNGWTTETHDATQPHTAVFAIAEPLYLAPDEELAFVMLHRSTVGDANIGRFRISVTDQPGQAVRSLGPMPMEELAAQQAVEPQHGEAELRQRLMEQFLIDDSQYQSALLALELAKRQLSECLSAAKKLKVQVLAEREEERSTFVLQRGVWDQPGERVEPAVPQSVLPWPNQRTQSRLDLAKWLVDDDNPLTARVVVNQLWQLCFGAGLVRTPEDFGLQGELPTHPQLLDWLAVELVDSDWNIKHLMRLIVTSDTYCQDSRVSSDQLERDPENRWLARGSRFRLPSWMIRDAALKSSGLLNPALGGPPVRPYQPEGVWAEMFMGRFRYEPSQGPAQFRRTLYAFWRRAAAPTFLFDSAQRRVCEVRPRRTNTPLHALTLLNDLSILESSRALARATVDVGGDTEDEKIAWIFRSILSRDPSEFELQVLRNEFENAFDYYSDSEEDARQLLDFGQPELVIPRAQPDMAAYLIVSSLLYNLDEAMTHE